MTLSRRLALLAGLTLLVGLLLPAKGGQRSITVAVVSSRALDPYALAVQGFELALSGAGVAHTLTRYDLAGEASNSDAVLKKMSQSPPDLVLTLGSLATTEISRREVSWPVVFCMVLDPASGGLPSPGQSSKRGLTGVVMDISPSDQLKAIALVLPDARKVGVLHSAQSAGAVESARAAASALGLELVTSEISAEREVSRALTALMFKSDVLLAVADSTVYTEGSTRFILLQTLRQAVPFMGLMDSFVEAGALMGLSLDFTDLGRQAGELGVDILGGARAGDLPIQSPRRTRLLINQRTARRIGVTIPLEALSQGEVLVP